MPSNRPIQKLISQLTEIAFDKIGHRNPQLLREWQGRLRWRNLLLTFALSFVIQGLTVLQRFTRLPGINYGSNRYCLVVNKTMDCQLGAGGQPLIDWPFLWADIFSDLSFVMVWVLIVGGVYLLAADLSKESRRGTLNFLRMSPLPGRQILQGKLLGVPVLLYLGLGAMLPLHVAMGVMGSYPVGILLAFYALLGAIALCFYAAALWFTVLTPGLQGLQAWLIAGLSCFVLFIGQVGYHEGLTLDWFRVFYPIHLLADWEVEGLGTRTIWPFGQGTDLNQFRDLGWFSLPIGSHGGWFLAFALANVLILGLWFWVALERKFQTPAKTALGKQQSYGLTLFLSLLMMGLTIQKIPHGQSFWREDSMSEFFWSYAIAMLLWGVILMFLLLPAKQVLLDWARYRHQRPSHHPSALQPFAQQAHRLRRSLITDLLFHDGSPSGLAFAVNLGIIGGVLLIGIMFNISQAPIGGAVETLLSWGFCAAVLVLCSLVVQWIALSNLLHWRWVAAGAVAVILAGWPLVLTMAGIDTYQDFFRGLWLMTAFSQAAIVGIGGGEIGLAIAAHLALIAGLSVFLGRRCQFLGQSEWKALMEANARRKQLQSL